MKKLLLKTVGLAALFVVSLTTLTGCGNINVWWDDPGPGWNTFHDNRLRGYWQLVQYNGYNVGGYDTNYLYFNGSGSGFYYYYDRGYRQREQIRYWSQDSYGGYNYQLNLQYQYSGSSISSYWFTNNNNYLWMQWTSYGGRTETYVYGRIAYAPW